MKSITKLALLAGVAGMCFAAGPFAPTAVGSFTLPYQTSWGKALLPAGHYTFTLDSNQYGTIHETITLRQGTKAVAVILARMSEPASSSGGSSMLIVNHTVHSLHLAPIGATYYFQEHKKRREFLASRADVRGISVVPVAAK